MKILLFFSLGLFIPVGVLLFTGHSGAAEKVTTASFFLLLGSLIWDAVSSKGGKG